MSLNYMEQELLSLYNEYEPCYDKLLRDAQSVIYNIEYGRGGELLHRGYYCPSPIFDIIVGNANRGKLMKRPGKDVVYDYVYYKNKDGNLIMVDRNAEIGDSGKILCDREFIIESGNKELAPRFEFMRTIDQINIVSISLCEYSEGRLTLYRNKLRSSIHMQDGTVSYVDSSTQAEDYIYNSSGLIDQATHGEKVMNIINETTFKFFHNESGILHEYQVIDNNGRCPNPWICQVQKSKRRIV